MKPLSKKPSALLSVLHLIVSELNDGRSVRDVAERYSFSKEHLYRYLPRYGFRIRTERCGYTMQSLGALFGRSGTSGATLRWFRKCVQTGLKVHQNAPGAHNNVLYTDLLAWLHDRRSWYLWSVDQITDPDLVHYVKQFRTD